MTRLELRLTHPYLADALPMGAVAKVQWVGRIDGSPPKSWWTEEKALPAGGIERAEFDLPDGGYYSVEVVRPRGSSLSAEYRVEPGQTLQEDIDLEASPHEYLSWDQLAGIVPRKLDVLAAAPDRRLRAGVSGSSLLHRALNEPADEPLLAGARIARSAGAWHDLTRLVTGVSPRDADRLRPRRDDDGRFVTWWFPALDDAARQRLDGWIRGNPPAGPVEMLLPPEWIFVAVDGALDLVALPWAWWLAPPDLPYGRDPIHVLHDRAGGRSLRGGGRGRTTVTIKDERWFPLLEFMAAGRLAEASSIADAVVTEDVLVSALYLKVKGPLLAAAAAIILSARTTSTDLQYWDPWLDNLANWFPRIPDGKIILGCRRLQQARSPSDRQAAFAHLRDGFDRGIPFFSATVRMFSLAMAQLGNDFDQAEALRLAAAPVAARVDPDQPFTVIRL